MFIPSRGTGNWDDRDIESYNCPNGCRTHDNKTTTRRISEGIYECNNCRASFDNKGDS